MSLDGLIEASSPVQYFYGIYAGIVEFNSDPLQLGRLVVRCLDIHGPKENIPTEGLPWARPCFAFGGAGGYGSMVIPPIGSTVWVVFDHGFKFRPVWIGTWNGLPTEDQVLLRNKAKKLPEGVVSMSPSPDKPWLAPPGPDAPIEFLRMADNRPERHVVFKSPKGATIDIEERDEVEKFSILDRLGQGLVFEAPVTVAENENNKSSRVSKTALEGDALSTSILLTKESNLSLVDAGSQSLTFQSGKVNRIILSSKENKETGNNKETTDNTKNSLELSASEGKFIIRFDKDGETKTVIHLDSNSGALDIKAASNVRIDSSTVQITGNLIVDGNVLVQKSILSQETGLFALNVESNNATPRQGYETIDNPSIN